MEGGVIFASFFRLWRGCFLFCFVFLCFFCLAFSVFFLWRDVLFLALVINDGVLGFALP